MPWRLEVEGPGGKAKGEFLHVLEVGGEEDSAMSRVELVEAERQVGVSLAAAGSGVVIRFVTEGPLAASIQIGDGPEETLGSDD